MIFNTDIYIFNLFFTFFLFHSKLDIQAILYNKIKIITINKLNIDKQ